MIEATCSACGTLNRVPDASVHAGARFFTCVGCKARAAIPLPTSPGILPKLTSPLSTSPGTLPKLTSPLSTSPGTLPKLTSPLSTSPGTLPKLTSPLSTSPATAVPPATKPTRDLDFADLPAPKRPTALGIGPPQPASRTSTASKFPLHTGLTQPLAHELDPELPAPKITRPGGPTTASRIELGELGPSAVLMTNEGGIDLPAPKRNTQRLTPESSSDNVADLPALRANRGVADLPAPKPSPRRAALDLPSLNLPTLKDPRAPAASTLHRLPTPQKGPTISDLPAPQKGPTIPDLPAPRTTDSPLKYASSDLPATKAFFDDLPQPVLAPERPATKAFFDDLPQAKLPQAQSDPSGDAPDAPATATKDFFDDLPQAQSDPSGDAPDAPATATKDFFDDLPQVKLPQAQSDPSGDAPEASATTTKDFFDDLPQAQSDPSSADLEALAPKGYFDNIPALPNTSKPELPAPKGYFDNIPALPNTSKPEAPAPKGYFDNIPALPNTSKPEAPAPQGYFDNVPGQPIKKSDALAPKGSFDDLPPPPHPAPDATEPVHPDQAAFDLLPTLSPAKPAPSATGPELDLVTPTGTGVTSFDDPDLSKLITERVRFGHGPRAPAAGPSPNGPSQGTAGIGREPKGDPQIEAKEAPPNPAPPGPVPGEAAAAKPRTPRTTIVLGGVLAVVLLGAGGFKLYRRHAEAQEQAAVIAEQLAIARTSFAAVDPRHWPRAAAAAQRVVALDPKNLEALGIGAESLLASALDDGTATATKIGQARAMLEAAAGTGLSSPVLTRARALAALAAHRPDGADGAIGLLAPLATQAPKDGAVALYLGWALEAKGDMAAALSSYDRAANDPAVKLDALYGRGNAKLARSDLDGARADFSAVLALAKDHLGALVGLAMAQPPEAAQQQEADLMAILARKDLADADPRVVARAWTSAGRAALRAGHGERARERFGKALGIVPQDLAATTGLAETELADGKLGPAADLLGRALSAAKDDVPAQLVQSEIEIKQHKLPLAAQRLAALSGHAAPLAPLEQARLHLLTGELLEAQGKDDAAALAYIDGAKVARELDLAPMVAAVKKLTAMAAAASDARDPARAGDLRARAKALLGEHAEHAEHDPRLAMTLGVAYLQAGDAAAAEGWLHRVVEARPDDAEARYQLGRALRTAGKYAEALEVLAAASSLDPGRADAGVELARTYEALGRDADAGGLYTKLLADKEPSLLTRAWAGRFFARTGALDQAREQGAKIVAVDPDNAAGLYLDGEGLLAGGKATEAKQRFERALESDRDLQYLDALGRAAEALAQDGDRELQDLALRSYAAVAQAAAPPLSPRNAFAGQGRLYVARHEAAKAVPPLLEAARLDPENDDIKFLLGAAYQELQKTTLALRALQDSTKRAPRADAFWRIAQIYHDTNRGSQAAAAVGTATRLAAEAEQRTGAPAVPWLTDALYLQGRINFDLHKEAAARDAWTLYVARNPPASARLTEVKQLLATALRR